MQRELTSPKVLMLLSGGLDSTLATKILLDQGLNVEALNFTTPFCLCDKCTVRRVVKMFKIRLHFSAASQDYLDLMADPPHGYGSQMNPCIDCRIYMFRKAREVAEKINAEFIATGEVLDERPFSQRRRAMLLIEREAGLEGKVLRPLSARLLPETEPERRGLVDREKLYAISGRRRLPQIELAEKFSINDYPCPSGGCLLTDPSFAGRLRDFLKHEDRLAFEDVTLLKLGRHFRVGESKIIVGRNKEENEKLLHIAEKSDLPFLELIGHKGPITLLKGSEKGNGIIEKAASITVRYSDAGGEAPVMYRGNVDRVMTARAANEDELAKWRINF